jgi:tetratricopeptide (TPR) repeat protein
MSRMFIAGALILYMATPTSAQVFAQADTVLQDSLLLEAVRLATEGQGDSARALVRSRTSELSPMDSLYPAALFTAGVVAGNSDSAISYFRQVSIEHSRSPWADQALLRMAELRFASGELAAAARSAERILLDYPFSDVLPKAAYWAGRAYLELGDAERGCPLLQRAGENAGNDIELGNRSRYYLQRCPGMGATTDSAVHRRDQGQPGTRTFFSVQVAAVSSVAAANEMMQALHDQGYESHVVRDEDGLFKIRVGRFADRSEAQSLVAELKSKVGGQPFVVEGS